MRVLGVIGTMVWDKIWRESDVGSPVEEWGGISYSLAAADATIPPDYKVRPVMKLGRDLADRGMRFIQELSVIESQDAIWIVDALTPRVELRYTGPHRRCEQLQGGVPPWTWPELASLIDGCDALYVNFITGAELGLDAARELRSHFDGPIYVDIHYLMMAMGPQGERTPRALEHWEEWLRCFDAVQVNEDELSALASHWGDPWAFAANVVGRETSLLFVTLGSEGAAYFMAPDALPLDGGRRPALERQAPVQTGKVASQHVAGGDPTGCGDVWGITAFGSLLAGHGPEEAVRRANQMAGRNVVHRGASGLNRFLKGEIERA
jgi:sugar/nucleoside kinase (ribokinase family)